MRLIVIGGGAAGFFCAVNAARMNPQLEVMVLEKSNKLLSKVKVSGGGRCNVTHACFSIPDILKKYPRGPNFLKKAFHEFFTTDTIDWFAARKVPLKTESDGRMFPKSDDSQAVIDCLLTEADKYRVQVRMHQDVKALNRKPATWEVILANGDTLEAEAVCIATGGFPKPSMFSWLTAIGHTISSPVPSLFSFNMPGNAIRELTGISLPARVKITGTKLEESGQLLITHWGISGPAVLTLSSRAARELAGMEYRFSVLVNWSPAHNETSVKTTFDGFRVEHAAQRVTARNAIGIPQRLWEYLCHLSEVGANTRWADLTAAAQNRLIKNVVAQQMTVEGKTTFKEEFVTAGGISLTEIDPRTMRSKVADNLYFAGEIMDVDGVTGGFNFQHAWTSGWIAARSVASL